MLSEPQHRYLGLAQIKEEGTVAWFDNTPPEPAELNKMLARASGRLQRAYKAGKISRAASILAYIDWMMKFAAKEGA